MNPFLAQIVMFAGNFAPRGWALCEGQLLPISSNSALFSILGITFESNTGFYVRLSLGPFKLLVQIYEVNSIFMKIKVKSDL